MADLIRTLNNRLRQKALENGKKLPDYLVVTEAEMDEYIDICHETFGRPAFVLLNGLMCPMFNGKPLILQEMVPDENS